MAKNSNSMHYRCVKYVINNVIYIYEYPLKPKSCNLVNMQHLEKRSTTKVKAKSNTGIKVNGHKTVFAHLSKTSKSNVISKGTTKE